MDFRWCGGGKVVVEHHHHHFLHFCWPWTWFEKKVVAGDKCSFRDESTLFPSLQAASLLKVAKEVQASFGHQKGKQQREGNWRKGAKQRQSKCESESIETVDKMTVEKNNSGNNSKE